MFTLAALLYGSLLAQSGMLDRIRDEAAVRSKVMDYAGELVDRIGPRLTGSPNLAKAVAWAQRELTAAGCSNVTAEQWGEFGMGWQERNVWLRMTGPDMAPLIARAAPWSPATPNGPVSGQVIKVRGFRSEADFAPYRRKLRGKIVLFGRAPARPEVFPIEKPLFERLTERQLEEFAAQPYERPAGYSNSGGQFELMEKAGRFFAAEQAAAILVPSGNNEHGGSSGGTIAVDTNYTFGWRVYEHANAMRTPLLVIAIEHYGRMERLLERGVPVRAEAFVDAVFSPGTQPAHNVFAEIPGADRKDEIVMLSAHLDSWSAGTGAVDDGAGVIIAMEAMRILRAVNAKPRRTIQLALWTGEEQGSLGSREWVKRHVAEVPLAASRLPEFLRPLVGVVKPKPMHSRISAVYTLDAGGGRIRGVSTGNPAAVPIFRQWLEPLRDLGVSVVAERSDCGGDCSTFEQVGIPAPSFKQDPLDYYSRAYHSNMDSYEHLFADDLKQAAIVVAYTIYQTAMREEMLPRN